MTSTARHPSLLVLDASYTLEMVRERGLEDSITCRDLDGFFRHVWSVHPFASLLSSPSFGSRYGKPERHEIAPRHTFIEGKVGLTKALAWLFPLNFLLSQSLLFFMLLRLIRREDVAVIRVGDPLYLGLFGLALARLSGRPLLIRVNGNNEKVRANTGRPLYPQLFRTPAIEERIERFVFPRADVVAAPNPDNVDFSIAAGARQERVTIFRYGNLLAKTHLQPPERRPLDASVFDALGVEPGRFLLCVSRLESVKFPDDALGVLVALASKGQELKLVFAGDGPMRTQLEQAAAAAGVAHRVVFAGNQNQHALSQLNARAAAVIAPLAGRALSESALAGAPIAAYDLDWQGELVETGVTGELAPFRDVGKLAAATLALLSDRDYAAAMGRAVRERALSLLDPERLNEHERDVYQALLSRRPIPRSPAP